MISVSNLHDTSIEIYLWTRGFGDAKPCDIDGKFRRKQAQILPSVISIRERTTTLSPRRVLFAPRPI